MSNIKVDFANSSVKLQEIIKYAKKVEKIHDELHTKANDENEFARMA